VSEEVALELDCREMRCPMPIIELAKNIDSVPIGSLIAVTAYDPAAQVDVQAWCRMRQQDYVGEDRTDDGAPRYRVRRRS
jgi:TusA-related sulfurtransferase